MRYFKNTEEFVFGKAVFCGIDVHKKDWIVCFVCDGEVVEKQRIPADFNRLEKMLMSYAGARSIQLVYEAGFCGFWLYRRLRAHGYLCTVTPPSLVPDSGSKVKTDNRDAQSLAFYLAAGLLKAVYVPPVEVESDRRIIRRRNQLRKALTRDKNQIKSFLHLHDIAMPADVRSKWSRAYLAWLASLSWSSPSDVFTMGSLLRSYARHREELVLATRYLRQLSRTEPYADNFKRLCALPGVGLITAMTFLLEIHDFARFKGGDQFASYLGLTPAQFSSGPHVRLGHITRQGNAHVRGALVESAWTVIRYDPHLRAKYERIRARGTNGKKAIVAVARSLAIRLRRCLLDETPYVVGVC